VKAILNHPALYQAYQNAGGFFGARVKAIADYLTLRSGMRMPVIVALLCGDGVWSAAQLWAKLRPSSG
jgi:hypothetical protein